MRRLRRISHSGVAVVALTLFCVSSGCDSTELQEPKPQIEVVDGIADQVTHIGDDDLRIALRPLFSRSDGGVMFFTGTPVGDKIHTAVVRDTLIVEAVAQGTDTVVVFAHGPEVDTSGITFAIRVLCSTEIGPDDANYFPPDIGRRWAYSYLEDVDDIFGTNRLTRGTAIWTVTGSDFDCRKALLTIHEEFEGTVRERWGSGDTVTTPVRWDRNLVAMLDGPSLDIVYSSDGQAERYVGPIKWRRSASEPEVVRVDSTLGCGFGGCTDMAYEVERDQGLKYWQYNHWRRPAPYRLELVRTDE